MISFSGLSTQVHTPHEHIHVPHAKMRREGVVEKGRERKEGERERIQMAWLHWQVLM